MENRLGNHVVVRREFSSDCLAIWLVDRQMNNSYKVAKPLKLEFEERESNGFFQLPEPTLILPGMAMQEFYKSLTQELEYSGERFMEAHSVLKSQDANLADLRKYLDKTFDLLLIDKRHS